LHPWLIEPDEYPRILNLKLLVEWLNISLTMQVPQHSIDSLSLVIPFIVLDFVEKYHMSILLCMVGAHV
jgi:hypothetical protein